MEWFVRCHLEIETLIKVENGIVKNISEVSNYINKPNRINRRYNDTLWKILFKNLQRIQWRSVRLCEFCERYEGAIGEAGKIKNVLMAHVEEREEINESWNSNEYNYCKTTQRMGRKDLRYESLRKNGILK